MGEGCGQGEGISSKRERQRGNLSYTRWVASKNAKVHEKKNYSEKRANKINHFKWKFTSENKERNGNIHNDIKVFKILKKDKGEKSVIK